MFTLQTFTTILVFLSFNSVQASPLSQRDVVAPPIIKPDATSVWPVGTQQLVTWDTSTLPPESRITNPIGQIILGFNQSDSMNLDFNHPLAKGFNITDGNVTVTVPDVPPRDDYLIVLFGDSGNTSPSFAITRISSPGSTSSSASSGSISDSSTVAATPLSITGSVTTAALTEDTPTSTDITTASLPTVTSPTGTSTAVSTGSSSSSSSSSSSAVTSAPAASSTTNAGWSIHRGGSIWNYAAPFLMSTTPSVIFLFLV